MSRINDRDSLVLGNRNLVYHHTKKYRHLWFYEDITQEGMMGLLKAASAYSPTAANGNFSCYASRCIKGEISHFFRDRLDLIRTLRGCDPISVSSLNAMISDNAEILDIIPSVSATSYSPRDEQIECLLEFAKCLSNRERAVLEMTIINDKPKDIARELNINWYDIGVIKRRISKLAKKHFAVND